VFLLVLLHERADAYWWFGAASADFALHRKMAAAGLPAHHPLPIMRQEGALDRYQIKFLLNWKDPKFLVRLVIGEALYGIKRLSVIEFQFISSDGNLVFNII
jgi:hypothetical protein